MELRTIADSYKAKGFEMRKLPLTLADFIMDISSGNEITTTY